MLAMFLIFLGGLKNGILLAMGSCGSLTRAMNPTLCPVTHPDLPTAAAPGQVTVPLLRSLQCTLGVLPKRCVGLAYLSSCVW